MITPTRKAILEHLVEMSELHPDWRFGQMVDNITVMAAEGEPTPTYDVDDSAFLEALKDYLVHRRQKPLQTAS
jgi:hypothetical protein